MPLTLTMTRDLCRTSDLLGYMAWFLYQDTLAPAGHPAACQASYPATASLTRAGMLVGPGDRRPGHADQRLTVAAAAFGQADGRPRRVHPPRTWPCGWALHSVLDWGRRLGGSPIRRAAADPNLMGAGTDRRQGDGRAAGGG